MPFKIYTYEDPYKLDKADFWSEISALPHFCSARTLVNGLKDVLGDNIEGLICPLDELVEHEEVYMQWTDNISLRVQQYSAFSAAFKQLLEKRRISKPFHMALEQNQNHFLEAVRLFIELDISASAIDGSKGNPEQKLFVHMLKQAQQSALFRFPKTPSREKLKEIVIALAKKEVEECTGTPQEVKRCERAVGITKEQPFDSIPCLKFIIPNMLGTGTSFPIPSDSSSLQFTVCGTMRTDISSLTRMPSKSVCHPTS